MTIALLAALLGGLLGAALGVVARRLRDRRRVNVQRYLEAHEIADWDDNEEDWDDNEEEP